MSDEGGVNEEVVVGVDEAVVVEVAVVVSFGLSDVAGVDEEVVVGVDEAIEVGVAVPGVLDEDGVGVDGLISEHGEDGVAGVGGAIEDDGEGCHVGFAGLAAGDAGAVPSRIASGPDPIDDLGEHVVGLGAIGLEDEIGAVEVESAAVGEGERARMEESDAV